MPARLLSSGGIPEAMGASIGLIVDALPDTEATESVPIAISQVILAI